MELLKEVFKESPLKRMDYYANETWPFLCAQLVVRVFYFFLAYSSVMLFFSWDLSIGPQTGISFIPPIYWLKFVDFPLGFFIIKTSFIISSIIASFWPQKRWVRILSFITLLEFVALYFSILKLDVDWYTMLLTGFFFIFLPNNWANPLKTPIQDKKKFLLIFWGSIAIYLLTYSMAGIGKIVGFISQINEKASFFHPKAGALHIADRLIVTDSTSPLGDFAVEYYILLWPLFVGALYLLIFSFPVAFKPKLHRIWAFGLIIFHTFNYLFMNIGFTAHNFLLSLLLILSPFAPQKVSIAEILKELPLIDVILNPRLKNAVFKKYLKTTTISLLILLISFLSLILISKKSIYPTRSGSFTYYVQTENLKREYLIYVPVNLVFPTAVVIALHGGGGPLGTAELMLSKSGWKEKADEEGFLAVFPQGTMEDPNLPLNLGSGTEIKKRNIRSWNDGSPEKPASQQGIDDLSYIKAVLNDVSKKFRVDENKIFVTGFSNGATMTYFLGVELSDRIAAIAPVAGLLYTDKTTLKSPVSLLNIVGDLDNPQASKNTSFISVTKNTKTISQRESIQSFPQVNNIETWKSYLNCKNVKIEDNDSSSVTLFSPCDENSEILTYVVNGIGHIYPGKAKLFEEVNISEYTTDATQLSWDFFDKHPKE